MQSVQEKSTQASVTREELIKELAFCIDLWEQAGSCAFGSCTHCTQCATPYLLLKLISGEILHGDMKRLTLEDWKAKLQEIQRLAPFIHSKK